MPRVMEKDYYGNLSLLFIRQQGKQFFNINFFAIGKQKNKDKWRLPSNLKFSVKQNTCELSKYLKLFKKKQADEKFDMK